MNGPASTMMSLMQKLPKDVREEYENLEKPY